MLVFYICCCFCCCCVIVAIVQESSYAYFHILYEYSSRWLVGWLVGCSLTSQQLASVSQGQICTDIFTCCHTEIEVADQTFYLTQSQYTDTGPTSPKADPVMPGAWQGSQFLSHWYDSTRKKSRRERDSNLGSSAPEADALITRPARRCTAEECASVRSWLLPAPVCSL